VTRDRAGFGLEANFRNLPMVRSDLPLLSSIENQREIMFDGYNTPHSLIREFL
jgi:hypothetical protein